MGSSAESSRLTGVEQLQWITEKTHVAWETLGVIQRMLIKAESEKDTLKLTCLIDKVHRIRASLTGVEERTDALRESISSGRTTEAIENFLILRTYIDRIFSLRVEAENCIGSFDVVFGETGTTMRINDTLPSEYSNEDNLVIHVDPPEHASGFF